jgi:hypothetical protein
MAEPHGQKAARDQFAETMRPIIEQAREQGVTSLNGLADYLTERGIRPFTGSVDWSHSMVVRLLGRIKKLDAPEAPGAARTQAQLAVSAARTKNAQAFADSMREHLLAAVASGAKTDREIMARFNRMGLRNRAGDLWTKSAVKYLRTRLGLKPFSD